MNRICKKVSATILVNAVCRIHCGTYHICNTGRTTKARVFSVFSSSAQVSRSKYRPTDRIQYCRCSKKRGRLIEKNKPPNFVSDAGISLIPSCSVKFSPPRRSRQIRHNRSTARRNHTNLRSRPNRSFSDALSNKSCRDRVNWV